VLQHLNAGNCFDFDYAPAEGDNLTLHPADDYARRLEFIFHNGRWAEGHYSPFEVETSRLNEGRVKPS
jgi:hypothetical protein